MQALEPASLQPKKLCVISFLGAKCDRLHTTVLYFFL